MPVLVLPATKTPDHKHARTHTHTRSAHNHCGPHPYLCMPHVAVPDFFFKKNIWVASCASPLEGCCMRQTLCRQQSRGSAPQRQIDHLVCGRGTCAVGIVLPCLPGCCQCWRWLRYVFVSRQRVIHAHGSLHTRVYTALTTWHTHIQFTLC